MGGALRDALRCDNKAPPMAEDKPPDEKRRRYDRQLRLWGEHGQAAMEDSSICLLNGSATGTETLKNLVLPGIGAFTIVDGASVTQADLGNNFFLDQESYRFEWATWRGLGQCLGLSTTASSDRNRKELKGLP